MRKDNMSYYFMAHYTVKDMETWQRYVPVGVPTVSQYGGKILVAAAPGLQQPAAIEGTPQHAVTVILEFASQSAFERWYTSPEYQAVVGMRTSSTEGWGLGLPAFEPPA
jgi:uncharacterized protein (DUF1330 family)